VSHFKLCDIV